MSPLEVVAVVLAGVAAGTINVVVGSGTLITFPVLLAVGYSPLVANVSNTIGLVPGSIAGAIGYKRELEGQRDRIRRLSVASVLGGTTGGVLLLVLPGGGLPGHRAGHHRARARAHRPAAAPLRAHGRAARRGRGAPRAPPSR